MKENLFCMLFSVSFYNLGLGVVVEAYCLNRGKSS